jgi:hypothetical protein
MPLHLLCTYPNRYPSQSLVNLAYNLHFDALALQISHTNETVIRRHDIFLFNSIVDVQIQSTPE